MVPFEYVNASKLEDLPTLLSRKWNESVVLAGGTDLLDMLKERLIQPKRVVNIKNIKELYGIQNGQNLKIGALTTIAEIAQNEMIRKKYPVLAQAAFSIATPQLRNMGTIGGNLCQRPRCWYFRGREYVCLKKGGSKCYAAEGLNKYNAIFGGGPSFIVHPSDSAPALRALGASVEVFGPDGTETIPLDEFFELPIDNLRRENVLRPNEIITKIVVPEPEPGTRSIYLKFREKQSMDFAISSVAAVLQMDGQRVKKASIVLGGVAPIPWRAEAAQSELEGNVLNEGVIKKAAAAAVSDAQPMKYNAYKIQLTKNLVRRALEQLA
ncbi:MAG: xanthine dehydrogenase family protein subunit M [Calditrichaeota bacterium]|nr:MAG: xanthine dehydrogenase family protein subunit M [Calditrichota bacterium]